MVHCKRTFNIKFNKTITSCYKVQHITINKAIINVVFKVPLRRKFCIPFSLQLLKVEVLNTYHAKFYIEIPTGRPVILIVKFSFVLPPLLDSKNGREPHRELDLAERNMTSYAHNNMARFRMADLAERSHISGSRAIFTTPTYCKHPKENSW